MKEYIEREEAVRAAKDGADEWDGGCSRYRDASIESAMNAIPAADVAEVWHGENIGEDYDAVDQFVCSRCGIELQGWYRVERDMDDGDETHHEYVFCYCPNCGAKMDGERKGGDE